MVPSSTNKSPKNSKKIAVASNNGCSKKPRFDKYSRLLHRFFEALILLHVLGQTRGKHDRYLGDVFTPQEKRRRLLCNLAYLCDYDKGGPTTSAIGIEDGPKQFIFWVASNDNGSSNKVLTFLRTTLAEAKKIIRLSGDRRLVLEDNFTQRCIEFAKLRVRKEAKMLWKAMNEAGKKDLDLERNSKGMVSAVTLGYNGSMKSLMRPDIQLWRWLQQFRQQDPVDLCSLAYDQRKASEMKYVVTKIDTPQGEQGVRTTSDVFCDIRHYVGRLAHHVRAPKQVLEDFACLEHVLDAYDIRLIGQVPNIEPPEADGHTTLEGIVKRMLPANDGSLPEYEDSLALMNQKFDLEKKVLEDVANPPVSVVDYTFDIIHSNAWNPPHITYLNWGPPLLPEGANDPGYVQQRKLMNDMLVTIRKEVLDQLRNKAGPLKWHPDSHTGITRSLASEPVDFGALGSVEDRLAGLDHDSTDPNTSETEGNRSVSPVYSSASSVKAAGSSSRQSSDSSDDDGSDSEGGVSLS
ncbi:hypothetical protein DL765_005044 [Monosporascus sp. GIB2]|nr:hypothetical protein DL765_005044 [Monosporascus sp. GIB2]